MHFFENVVNPHTVSGGAAATEYALAPTMLAAQLAVRFASAVVFSGVIAKLACDGLARTGVLRSYAVGARLAPVSIDDEEE